VINARHQQSPKQVRVAWLPFSRIPNLILSVLAPADKLFVRIQRCLLTFGPAGVPPLRPSICISPLDSALTKNTGGGIQNGFAETGLEQIQPFSIPQAFEDMRRFRRSLYFHQLTNPSLATIDFHILCSHQLTNPFSHNSFLFSSIQNTGAVGGVLPFLRHSNVQDVPAFRDGDDEVQGGDGESGVGEEGNGNG
jgi:hypothetical protein